MPGDAHSHRLESTATASLRLSLLRLKCHDDGHVVAQSAAAQVVVVGPDLDRFDAPLAWHEYEVHVERSLGVPAPVRRRVLFLVLVSLAVEVVVSAYQPSLIQLATLPKCGLLFEALKSPATMVDTPSSGSHVRSCVPCLV
jgi:hypothetical protein